MNGVNTFYSLVMTFCGMFFIIALTIMMFFDGFSQAARESGRQCAAATATTAVATVVVSRPIRSCLLQLDCVLKRIGPWPRSSFSITAGR